MGARLVLVRHGRSAHAQAGRLDAEGLRAWLRAYDAAGLAPDQAPPTALRALAARADLLVTSDLPRARESAALLGRAADGREREVVVSPLLRELELWVPAAARSPRLPLAAWAVTIGARRALDELTGRRPPPDQLVRVEDAAAWLTGLAAARRATVLVVTHASFRRLLSRHLRGRGWHPAARVGGVRPWSAWTFVEGPSIRSAGPTLRGGPRSPGRAAGARWP